MYRVDGIWVCTLIGRGIGSVIFQPSPLKKIFCVCDQSLVLDHLFAFFCKNVEFFQVIFNVITFSGLTYKNNEASCFIIYCLAVLQLIYSVVNSLYES